MNIKQVDESRLAALMKGANPDNFFKSGVYGVLAAAMCEILGAGHHIKYALSAWVFVRSDCDHRGFQIFEEMYYKLPLTKLCYAGWLVMLLVMG